MCGHYTQVVWRTHARGRLRGRLVPAAALHAARSSATTGRRGTGWASARTDAALTRTSCDLSRDLPRARGDDQGNWILPRGGPAWPSAAAAPASGITIDEACWRRISCSSFIVSSKATLAPSAKSGAGLGEVLRIDLERQRQHARGRHDLRLADVQRRARRVRRAVGLHGRHDADRAHLAVGVNVFAVQVVRVHLRFGGVAGHGRPLGIERALRAQGADGNVIRIWRRLAPPGAPAPSFQRPSRGHGVSAM